MSTKEEKQIFKSALSTFIGGASLIYIIALVYSIMTKHFTAAILLGGMAVLIAILVVWLIRTED